MPSASAAGGVTRHVTWPFGPLVRRKNQKSFPVPFRFLGPAEATTGATQGGRTGDGDSREGMKSSSDARVKPKACSGAPGDARPEVQNQLDADVCPNMDELRARLLAHWRDVERRAVALPQIVLSRGPAMSLHQVTGGVDWRAVRAIAASREPGRYALLERVKSRGGFRFTTCRSRDGTRRERERVSSHGSAGHDTSSKP